MILERGAYLQLLEKLIDGKKHRFKALDENSVV